MRIGPNKISYYLISANKAKTVAVTRFNTGISLFSFTYSNEDRKAQLREDGTLILYPGFTWDFGSGPAIDTPDVVIASLCHDALGWLIENKKLPNKYRKVSDRLYRELLKENGTGFFRRWYHYLAVRAYSIYRGAVSG